MGLALDNTSRCQEKSPENRHFNISQKPPNWSLQLKACKIFDKRQFYNIRTIPVILEIGAFILLYSKVPKHLGQNEKLQNQ